MLTENTIAIQVSITTYTTTNHTIASATSTIWLVYPHTLFSARLVIIIKLYTIKIGFCTTIVIVCIHQFVDAISN